MGGWVRMTYRGGVDRGGSMTEKLKEGGKGVKGAGGANQLSRTLGGEGVKGGDWQGRVRGRGRDAGGNSCYTDIVSSFYILMSLKFHISLNYSLVT